MADDGVRGARWWELMRPWAERARTAEDLAGAIQVVNGTLMGMTTYQTRDLLLGKLRNHLLAIIELLYSDSEPRPQSGATELISFHRDEARIQLQTGRRFRVELFNDSARIANIYLYPACVTEAEVMAYAVRHPDRAIARLIELLENLERDARVHHERGA